MERVGKFCVANEVHNNGHNNGRKTRIWQIVNGTVLLGHVKWFSRWRCYSFFPSIDTVFEKACLRAIADFCDQKTDSHRRAIHDRKRLDNE